MTATELTKTVRELKELKAMAADLTMEITILEDILKAEMTARGTDEMTVDVFKVRWTAVTSNRFDSTAFTSLSRLAFTSSSLSRLKPGVSASTKEVAKQKGANHCRPNCGRNLPLNLPQGGHVQRFCERMREYQSL